MRIDKFSMAKGWMMQDDASPEEAKATWDFLEKEFEDNRNNQLMASAETDAIIQSINDKFGPGTMFPASDAPQPPMTDTQRIMEWEERNRYSDGQLVTPSGDGSRPGYRGKEKELTPIMEERILEYNEWAKKNKKPLYNELPSKQNWKKLDIREGTWTGGGKKVDIEIRKFYNDVLNDYNTHVNNLIKEGDINKVKGFKDFTKNYTRPDGKPIKYNIISSWLTDNNQWPLQAQEIKRTIYNNAVNEANKGDKWIHKKTLANNMGMKNERELFNFTKYYKNIGGKLKELDSVETKMTRNANKFFSNLDQPVENFFSPIDKISKMTGVSQGAGSKALKNYNFPIDREIINSLGSATVQGKVAGMDWKLDNFIDYYNNKSFMEPSTLKQLANVDRTAANIVQDAWRHTLQGGKDIEWIELPKINKEGKVTSWLDAKFKYVGKDINTPLNQRKIWTVGNQNPNKNIFNIDFVGRDAPEFKNQFKITEDLFNFNNELVKHPVKNTMVKRGQLMKEVYHYGTGVGFDRSAYQRDHFDIKKDPLGLKKHKVNGNIVDGLRILPSRINQAAGNIKLWKGYTEKGLGTPVTKLKYAETAGAEKYKKIGYNFNKSPAELAASEYEFSKKFFNKFQAAGWQWDGKNWKIKPGMENSANAVLTNEGRIIRKPIEIATDYKKIGQTILKEQDWWKMPPKQQVDIFKMAGLNKKTIDQLTDGDPKLKKFVSQNFMPSGLSGAYEMLSDDLKKIINSDGFKKFSNNPALKKTLAAGKLPTKLYGPLDLVLGYFDYQNNRQKGFSVGDSIAHAGDMMLFGITDFGKDADVAGVKEIALKNGMSPEVFDGLVAANKNQNEVKQIITDFAALNKQSEDLIASGIGNQSTEYAILAKNKKDNQEKLKNLFATAIKNEPSLRTNLQIQEAGAPININVDKGKAFANLNKASAEFVQKRIDESDLENIAQQDDTTMGKIGARTKMTIGDPEWWLNLSLNQPWKKTAGMKRFESMNQLKKEDPTLYYKMLLSEGVDPHRNMNIPVRLQFEMENPEFGTPLSSQIKSTSYFDGGIASLRRKK